MVVRLISTAQTGYFYTTQRLRQGPKLSAVKYDPRGKKLSFSPGTDAYMYVSASLVKQRVLFVESKKTKKGQ